MIDVPPQGGVRPHHHPHVPLHPGEAAGAPGGAGVGVVAGLEADGAEGADIHQPFGREAEDEGVDPFLHGRRIALFL